MTAIIPEFQFVNIQIAANEDSLALGGDGAEFSEESPVSLTRVLKLRCTLRDRINRWAQRSRSAMVLFEGNSHTAAMYYIQELGEQAGAANDAYHFDEPMVWGGGPIVRTALVGQLMPHVVSEAMKMGVGFDGAAEVMLTDVLHEMFEEVFHDIETVRSGLIQKISDVGGNLVALGAIVERVDALTIPEVPTQAEIVRDLLLGYAFSQCMHIHGDRDNLVDRGNFYRSRELCDASGVHAQGICIVLNRLPDVELPAGRGELLQAVEFHALG